MVGHQTWAATNHARALLAIAHGNKRRGLRNGSGAATLA
jgi:hypothetical protein